MARSVGSPMACRATWRRTVENVATNTAQTDLDRGATNDTPLARRSCIAQNAFTVLVEPYSRDGHRWNEWKLP